MMNRQLSMAWEKWQDSLNRVPDIHSPSMCPRWQEWYAEMKDQQRLMGGALTRFMKRQLSMAWEVYAPSAPPVPHAALWHFVSRPCTVSFLAFPPCK
jgi:hypothetical protein